jgi:hypothetical protein
MYHNTKTPPFDKFQINTNFQSTNYPISLFVI